MYDKEKGLIDAYIRGQMSRRSLIRGLARLAFRRRRPASC